MRWPEPVRRCGSAAISTGTVSGASGGARRCRGVRRGCGDRRIGTRGRFAAPGTLLLASGSVVSRASAVGGPAISVMTSVVAAEGGSTATIGAASAAPVGVDRSRPCAATALMVVVRRAARQRRRHRWSRRGVVSAVEWSWSGRRLRTLLGVRLDRRGLRRASRARRRRRRVVPRTCARRRCAAQSSSSRRGCSRPTTRSFGAGGAGAVGDGVVALVRAS